MKAAYINKKFRAESQNIIKQAEIIINEFIADEYDLTVRQLYYQFIARDLFPENRRWQWTGRRWVRDSNGTKNADPNYEWLGGIIRDARMAGLINWLAIVDRTRSVERNSHWDGPEDILQSCAEGFRIDTRADQDKHIEVWIEKDALVGVTERICKELDINYLSCRGYLSLSVMWRAAQRFIKKERGGKNVIVLHLGDHDPSGIDMSRDIQDRLRLFGSKAEVVRIALNFEQIEELNPPPSPAKTTDSRYGPYIDEFGEDTWELDALDPREITTLIREGVEKYTDQERLNAKINEQIAYINKLQSVANNWEGISEYLEDYD